MATAGVQTTVPLALGLLLENGSYTLACATGSVPITAKDATLFATASGADIATTVPLILGMQLGTSGASNYILTAATGSVPITGKNANIFSSADTCDAQLTVPLALGFLLTSQSFILTAAAGTVPVNFAPAASSQTDVPDAPTGGGRVRQTVVLQRGKSAAVRQHQRDELDVFDIIMAIAHGATCPH